ncbi:MAG: 4-alpha-glucanotransferase, partial [Bacilli bacterium]|nr:4-alpha-glucanotransferase [Bacilli bacterium]
MKEKGILLHISSLPSPYGIGSFGKEAYKFVDFLSATHQDYWQVLPLGPTSYGDSPYQSFCAFAGNPYFIDLDILVEKGLLEPSEVKEYARSDSYVDYKWLYDTRYIVLKKAFSRFKKDKDYNDFLEHNKDWLTDYALFMTLKTKYPEGNFLKFPKCYQDRYSEETKKFEKEHQDELDFWRFLQYEFNNEWLALRKYANSKGIKIIGDMPIYVAYDSSDVYSDPKNFKLNPDLTMKKVAGVPPDYFAKYGQLWGNPIYRYDVMKKDHYSWWIKRFKKAFELYDVVRIDHFR